MVKEQVELFFRSLGYELEDDIIITRRLTDSNDKKVYHFFDFTLEGYLNICEELKQKQWELFTPINGGRKAQDIKLCKALFIEFDHIPQCSLSGIQEKGSFEEQETWVKQVCEFFSLPYPTTCLTVGKGNHFYWNLEKFIDSNLWVEAQTKLSNLFGSDRTLKNTNRLMRIPGGYHVGTNTIVSCNTPILQTVEFSDIQPRLLGNRPEKAIKAPLTAHQPSSDIDDLIANISDPRLVFTWSGHKFKESGDKFRGFCPGHNSKSGTSFWCKRSVDTNNWIFACPDCTDNKFYNALAYHHWLNTGILSQPTGSNYLEALRNMNIEPPESLELTSFTISEGEETEERKAFTESTRARSTAWVKYDEGCKRIKQIKDEFEKNFEIAQLAKTYNLSTSEVRSKVDPVLKTKVYSVQSGNEVFSSVDNEGLGFIYEGLVPKSELMLFTSLSGCGKSSLMGDLTSAMSNNKEFLGVQYTGNNKKILYCADDESNRTWKTRLKRLCVNPDRIDKLNGLKITDLDRLELTVLEGNYELIIIDSFTSLINCLGIDENHSSASDGLYRLSEIAHTYNVTIFVTHHNNKSDKPSGTERLRSPTWATWVMTARSDLPANYRLLQTNKTRESDQWSMVLSGDFENSVTYKVISRAYGEAARDSIGQISETFWADKKKEVTKISQTNFDNFQELAKQLTETDEILPDFNAIRPELEGLSKELDNTIKGEPI
jgi:hypothetical protein